MKQANLPDITAWRTAGALCERYRYSGPMDGALPPHVHEEYQFCIHFNTPGHYLYRGARHAIPAGSLSVIHPGEIHAPGDRSALKLGTEFWIMFLSPAQLIEVAREVDRSVQSLPFFSGPVICDTELATTFCALHRVLEPGTVSYLEQESRLLLALTALVRRHAQTTSALCRFTEAAPAIIRVRDYLHDNYTQNVNLHELATVANLSPYHLCRAFRVAFGVPPYRYLTGVRVDRAKMLLLRGESLTRVASEVGFFDQSHFIRYFTRFVGTTPGRYARSVR